MAEELVLPASVTDKFSKPLQDLQRRLRDFKATPGLAAVEKHFVGLRKQIEAATGAIRSAGNGLASGLGLPGLSIGALSAASAMATLGASVQIFAKNTVDIRKFTQETGIAGQKLKELKAVAAGLGIDESVVQGGLVFGAQNYAALKRGQGNYADIANLRGGGQSIANELKGAKDANDYTERGLGILNRQKTAEQRRVLSRLIFGTEEYSPFGANGIEDLNQRRKAARASIGGQTKDDEKNAQAFLDATSKISASIDKMTNSVGGTLAPFITQMAESINTFSNDHMGEVKSFFTEVGKSINSVDWAGNTKAIVGFLKDVNDRLNAINDASARAGQFVHDLFTGGGKVQDRPIGPVQGSGGSGSTRDPQAGQGTQSPNVQNNGDDILKGSRYDDGGLLHKSAFRPGAALTGISATGSSAAVAVIAAGVLKGMQDFAASLQGSAGGSDGVGASAGGGFMNASYQPGGGGIRMGGGGSGGSMSYTSAKMSVARGALARNQKEGYAALRGLGIDHGTALAVIANASGEALSDPSNVHPDPSRRNPNQKAHGVFQWDDTRAARIAKQFGKRPEKMSVGEQMQAFVWEVQKFYPGVWKVLQSGASPEEKVAELVRNYEIPRDKAKAIAQRLGMLKGLPKTLNSDVANRPSLAKKTGAVSSGKDGANGRVDIHVHSKDQPVDMKTNNAPVFGETKLNRGKSVGLMDI